MIYGEQLYNEGLYSGLERVGSWSNTLQMDYTEGSTVFLTLTCDCTIPEGTSVKVYAGETIDTLQEFALGVRDSVVFSQSQTGLVNLFLRLDFYSNQAGLTPVIRDMTIDIEQDVSLYTIANSVFRDASLPFGSVWHIDTDLQDILVPYSILPPSTHYDAMSQIIEACGARVYQNREGELVLTLPGNLTGNGTTVQIGENKIYELENSSGDIVNRVIMTVRPLLALDEQVVWERTGQAIGLNERLSFDMRVRDMEAVINQTVRLESTGTTPASIVSVENFAWGASVTVQGGENDQTIDLYLDGQPLVIGSTEDVENFNSESIRLNGERALVVDSNPLIQTRSMANKAGGVIVNEGQGARRNIDLLWRGNPCLEVGDRVNVNGIRGVVVGSEINFNGYLRVMNAIRRT